DGGSGFEPHFVGKFLGEVSGELVAGDGFIVEAISEGGEIGVEGCEEVLGGKPAPLTGEHSFVSGGADASDHLVGFSVSGEDGGYPVATFSPGVGRCEYIRGDAGAMEDL